MQPLAMLEDGHRARRQIRCSECHGLFWLRYRYFDAFPLVAGSVACPNPECKRLNRIYLPAGADDFAPCEQVEVLNVQPAHTAADEPPWSRQDRSASRGERSRQT